MSIRPGPERAVTANTKSDKPASAKNQPREAQSGRNAECPGEDLCSGMKNVPLPVTRRGFTSETLAWNFCRQHFMAYLWVGPRILRADRLGRRPTSSCLHHGDSSPTRTAPRP